MLKPIIRMMFSFILHVDGENLLIDIGSGEYTKEYFGPERYTILCNGSQGHSVPVVEGGVQKEGKDFKSGGIKSGGFRRSGQFCYGYFKGVWQRQFKSFSEKLYF